MNFKKSVFLSLVFILGMSNFAQAALRNAPDELVVKYSVRYITQSLLTPLQVGGVYSNSNFDQHIQWPEGSKYVSAIFYHHEENLEDCIKKAFYAHITGSIFRFSMLNTFNQIAFNGNYALMLNDTSLVLRARDPQEDDFSCSLYRADRPDNVKKMATGTNFVPEITEWNDLRDIENDFFEDKQILIATSNARLNPFKKVVILAESEEEIDQMERCNDIMMENQNVKITFTHNQDAYYTGSQLVILSGTSYECNPARNAFVRAQ